MTPELAAILAFDGLTNGAVYLLLGVAMVLVFSVTRVVFVPQGDFVAYGALTLAVLRADAIPPTVYLVLAAGAGAFVCDLAVALRSQHYRGIGRSAMAYIVVPILLGLVSWHAAGANWPLAADALVAVALVAHLGLTTYRLVFRPAQRASMLVLLVMAMALHFVLNGVALVSFGAEGVRLEPLIETSISLGALSLQGQALAIFAVSAALIAALAIFFTRTLLGKTLRAAAVNRLGCRLMGYRPQTAGSISFTLAAAIGAVSGVLIAPVTTIYYDSGFLIGLKGFVGAIIGGLASYPVTAAGALFVGVLEAAGSFWSSAHKEVIVFLLVLPVLMWRSLASGPHHEEEVE